MKLFRERLPLLSNMANMLGKLWQSVKQKVIADDVSLTD